MKKSKCRIKKESIFSTTIYKKKMNDRLMAVPETYLVIVAWSQSGKSKTKRRHLGISCSYVDLVQS